MARKLRIAIDCRITDPQQGIGTALLALAKTFSDSDTTGQEYTFIAGESMKGWLAPYIHGPCKVVCPLASNRPGVKAALRHISPVRFLWQKAASAAKYVPVSDGYVESQQFDVVHFPTQAAYLTELPTIYQPHDLQHLHYPQFFPKAEFLARERLYRAHCDRATYVCVHAEWTKRDVIDHYEISDNKIIVIPWGSVFDAYQAPSTSEIEFVVKKHHLPETFLFYPAATWPHKNHEVIFRALHILKSKEGMAVDVVFTGSSTGNRRTLDNLACSLDIYEQVHFLGFVTPQELQSIFRTATAMVYASKFEGFGLPILEAFHARLPVLSSNATTLPEVARDGALFFNPDSPTELAGLIKTTLSNPQIQQDLISRGSKVLSMHSFHNTAAQFQALYEKTSRKS